MNAWFDLFFYILFSIFTRAMIHRSPPIMRLLLSWPFTLVGAAKPMPEGIDAGTTLQTWVSCGFIYIACFRTQALPQGRYAAMHSSLLFVALQLSTPAARQTALFFFATNPKKVYLGSIAAYQSCVLPVFLYKHVISKQHLHSTAATTNVMYRQSDLLYALTYI